MYVFLTGIPYSASKIFLVRVTLRESRSVLFRLDMPTISSIEHYIHCEASREDLFIHAQVGSIHEMLFLLIILYRSRDRNITVL